ncbi:MAG: NADH:flavin oxidoreductase, partial [Nitrospinota bacterium]
MASLFDKTSINTLTLKNRLIRSATWEGMCDDEGRPTGKLVNWYRNLSRGGVGLIITGYAFVRPEGKQLQGQMGIHTDTFSSEMKSLTKAVHSEGGKICLQLFHAGGQTDSAHAGKTPLAPSPVKVPQYSETPRELSEEEISSIVDSFGSAAARAKSFGFDGVQLHGAHGYLINQFLSPHTNLRNDMYGGSIKNRCRFMMEVFRKVREQTGADYPVMIKLTGTDFLTPKGLTKEDALYAAEFLSDEGVDSIEVSGGIS